MDFENKINGKVLDFYLASNDFNGIPLSEIINKDTDVKQAKLILKNLILNNKVDLNSSDVNPHIKRFDLSSSKENQIKSLEDLPNEYPLAKTKNSSNLFDYEYNVFSSICLYPTEESLFERIGSSKEYLELPHFTKMLYFGKPQLDFLFFRIDVLDRYLEDPRYTVNCQDYRGSIHYSGETPEHSEDDTFLEHFGLAYNTRLRENLICVFVRDLKNLSERHQNHFFSYLEVKTDNHIPDYDYYRNSILAEWAENGSIFEAFLEEIKIINLMTIAMCNNRLFKNEFATDSEKRPEYFHPFLKPTKTGFDNFCRTLDKLFTENLNKDCLLEMNKLFGSKMVIEELDGSLAILGKFFKDYFRPNNREDLDKLITHVWKRKIRRSRSKASHHINENQYDLKIFGEYSKTIDEAYRSIRLIRLVLSGHPKVKNLINSKAIKIPKWLFDGAIRNYFYAGGNS